MKDVVTLLAFVCRRMFCRFVLIQKFNVFERATAVVTLDSDVHFLLMSRQPFRRAQCDITFIALVLDLEVADSASLWQILRTDSRRAVTSTGGLL